MGRKIQFASTNKGKLTEMYEIGTGYGVEILSADQWRELHRLLPFPEVEETGTTYAQNAALKARAFYAWGRGAVIADDTGIEVSALAGAPGVYTARYAGPACDPSANMSKLLQSLEGVRDRSARFVCALHSIDERGVEHSVEAYLEGTIARAPIGGAGFGYDPVFIVGESGQSLALLKESRRVLTHRALAAHKLFTAMGLSPQAR